MPAATDPFDAGAGSILRQPKAVWATAGASVVAFMGIGLVDPILPSIAQGLDATASQVSLLFTSYFLITAVAMLVTGFVSSRIGGRKTLLLGLALVVVFAALSGISGSVGELVGFRAGWGLGNALFVSTALAVIVGAAAGGSAAAILLYESALGLGMACGPLLGAVLGDVSWRYPFFGTAVLMAVGFLCHHGVPEGAAEAGPQDLAPRPDQGARPRRPGLRRGLGVLLQLHVLHRAGLHPVRAEHDARTSRAAVFFAWGVLLAVFSVIVAPRLQQRFGSLKVLGGSLVLLAADLLVLGYGDHTTRRRLHDPVRRLHRPEQHRLHGAGAGRLGRAAPGGERRLQLRALVRGGGRAVLRAEDRGVDRHPHPVRGRGGRGGARRGRGRRPAPGADPPRPRSWSRSTPAEDGVAVFAD